jgi:chaperone BCS1
MQNLIAAMANYLRFNIFDLDLSQVRVNAALQRLLISMPNKSILVIEDIDCCFDANPREHHHKTSPPAFQTKRGKLGFQKQHDACKKKSENFLSWC